MEKPGCPGSRPAPRLHCVQTGVTAPAARDDQDVLVVDMSYDTVTGVPALFLSS